MMADFDALDRSRQNTGDALNHDRIAGDGFEGREKAVRAALIQQAGYEPGSLSAADVKQLQRAIGNQAVGQLMESLNPVQKADEIPEEEEEEPVQGMMAPVQKVADGIPEEGEEPLQGKMAPLQMAKTNHTGMPDEVKGKMEGAFDADFSDVRVHPNSDLATDIGALAYTQGSDVHFAPGQYNPGDAVGQRIIGHELAHVIQQRDGRVQPTTQALGMPVNDDPGLEGEADIKGAAAVEFEGKED
jgi:hypothetical protein